MNTAINDLPGEFTAPGEVRFVRLLPGPIERVWAYLTDGEKRAKWLAGGPMELRVGGRAELKFRHADIAPDEKPPAEYQHMHDIGETMVGQVTRCEPPRVLAYTWWTESKQGSEVTFELTPEGDAVRLVLTHRRLGPDPKELASVGAGWDTHLAILVGELGGRARPPFWATHARLAPLYARRLSA